MEETNLFEELLKIDSNLNIKLESTKLKPQITIIGMGSIDKKILWKILKLVDKSNARLKLLPYGVIQIKF